MDGRNSYTRIIKLMEILPEEIHLDELKRQIIIHIGSSPQTITANLNLMKSMGFIKENPNKPFFYNVIKNGNK